MKQTRGGTLPIAVSVIFIPLLVVVTFGCGDGSSQPTASAPGKSLPAVSESEHQKFEKKYTELCIRSQQENPESQITDDQQLGALCRCMAETISKRLSKAEAIHFLDKREVPIDIVMMGNAAANTCAQGGR